MTLLLIDVVKVDGIPQARDEYIVSFTGDKLVTTKSPAKAKLFKTWNAASKMEKKLKDFYGPTNIFVSFLNQ